MTEAQQIKDAMTRLGLTLSTAESCTSGGIAARLTAVSGASDYFQGGLVAYQDRLKVQYLGVSAHDIALYDVVSQPVVEQMVRGACHLFSTHCAIASTGYAGDGAHGIPSGTIWIAWGTATDVHSRCLTLHGTRAENTATAIEQSLEEFLRYLQAQ